MASGQAPWAGHRLHGDRQRPRRGSSLRPPTARCGDPQRSGVGTRNGPAGDPQRPLSLAGTDFNPPTGQTSLGRYPPDWRALSAGQWALRQVLGARRWVMEARGGTTNWASSSGGQPTSKVLCWRGGQAMPAITRPTHPSRRITRIRETSDTYQRDPGEDPEARRA